MLRLVRRHVTRKTDENHETIRVRIASLQNHSDIRVDRTVTPTSLPQKKSIMDETMAGNDDFCLCSARSFVVKVSFLFLCALCYRISCSIIGWSEAGHVVDQTQLGAILSLFAMGQKMFIPELLIIFRFLCSLCRLFLCSCHNNTHFSIVFQKQLMFVASKVSITELDWGRQM